MNFLEKAEIYSVRTCSRKVYFLPDVSFCSSVSKALVKTSLKGRFSLSMSRTGSALAERQNP